MCANSFFDHLLTRKWCTCRPAVMLQRTFKFRPNSSHHSGRYLTTSTSRDMSANDVLTIHAQTTLALVEDMVRRSVEHLLLENQKKAAIETSKMNPMVFLGKTEFGDYQCNIALTLSKPLQMKPKDIAEKLMGSMMQNAGTEDRVVEKMDISGPGFINIHLNPQYLQHRLQHMLGASTAAAEGKESQSGDHSVNRLGIRRVAAPQKIVIDFSSPNIAKEMHVVSKTFLLHHTLSYNPAYCTVFCIALCLLVMFE